MLAKRRSSVKTHRDVVPLERLKLPVMKIKMSDYESFHSDKERLQKSAIPWLTDPLDLDATMDLESLRKLLAKDHPMETCCFLDCKHSQIRNNSLLNYYPGERFGLKFIPNQYLVSKSDSVG